jgi:signal transduction histidine kinase
MNLIRNAVQALEAAMPETLGEGEVHVRAHRDGPACVIEVADNGPGVPEKARAHLFEAFRGSQRQGGTGLGLAISSELVRAHGGQIRLVDSSGPGAVFQIIIPDRLQEVATGRRGERTA